MDCDICFVIFAGTDDLFDITANDGIISVKSDIDREALLDINYVVALKVTVYSYCLNLLRNFQKSFIQKTIF